MKKTIFVFLFFLSLSARSQNDRVTDDNSIGWIQTFITVPINKKWDLLPEYQWRRTDGLKNWQQSLLRAAFQYKINNQVAVAVGYGWIKTFPYGDYPIAANGSFPEHRLHEQIQIRQSIGKFSISQRLRIEQRWLGRKTAGSDKVEEFLFSHRFRYLLRAQHPLSKSGKLYAALADEIFISAGKNVGVNVFDQNRLMGIVGTKINPHISLEVGYIKQTVMQGRRINNSTIIQNNNGFTLAGIFSL